MEVIMQKLLLLVSLLFLSQNCFAQNEIKDTVANLSHLPTDIATINFTKINTNIIYPKEAINKNILNGTVYCSFKIDKQGKLYDITIDNTSNKLFNKYAKEYLEGLQAEVKPEQINIPFSIKLIFQIE